MPIRAMRVSSALKHGAYSKAALLPREDPAAFEELHRGLVAEFTPHGRMEEETVATIAHVMWRRQNLAKFGIGLSHLEEGLGAAAQESQQHDNSKEGDKPISAIEKLYRAGEQLHKTAEENRKGAAAVEFLDLTMKKLEVEDRLDAMIDRLIKRLLFVRGLKSITSSAPTVSPSSAKRLPPF